MRNHPEKILIFLPLNFPTGSELTRRIVRTCRAYQTVIVDGGPTRDVQHARRETGQRLTTDQRAMHKTTTPIDGGN